MRVRGHQAGAQQALVRRRRGRQRGVDVDAVLVEILRDRERGDLLIGVDRDDEDGKRTAVQRLLSRSGNRA